MKSVYRSLRACIAALALVSLSTAASAAEITIGNVFSIVDYDSEIGSSPFPANLGRYTAYDFDDNPLSMELFIEAFIDASGTFNGGSFTVQEFSESPAISGTLLGFDGSGRLFGEISGGYNGASHMRFSGGLYFGSYGYEQDWSDQGYITATAYGDNTSLVPVPAAAWLFGSGLAGLSLAARRKKAA